MAMDLLPWARALAEQLLAEPLPRRWAHTQGVGYLAELLADILGEDAELLAAAAWLHDIGYAPDLVKTGMHQFDGARYLRDVAGADPQICSLVAHHTCACIEAGNRGMQAEFEAEFPPVAGLLADALTYCDMTTTPDGELTDAKDRLAEILDRYGHGTLVFDTMTEASPFIFEAVGRISALISAQR
jgi:putative nucleotidyltransferase with HDIG domain